MNCFINVYWNCFSFNKKDTNIGTFLLSYSQFVFIRVKTHTRNDTIKVHGLRVKLVDILLRFLSYMNLLKLLISYMFSMNILSKSMRNLLSVISQSTTTSTTITTDGHYYRYHLSWGPPIPTGPPPCLV